MTTTTSKRIPTSTRMLLTLINDRCLDVDIGGTHWAYFDIHPGQIPSRDYLHIDVTTMPVGYKHTSPESINYHVNLADLWHDNEVTEMGTTAKDRIEKQLEAIISHLDGLVILALHQRQPAEALS